MDGVAMMRKCQRVACGAEVSGGRDSKTISRGSSIYLLFSPETATTTIIERERERERYRTGDAGGWGLYVRV